MKSESIKPQSCAVFTTLPNASTNNHDRRERAALEWCLEQLTQNDQAQTTPPGSLRRMVRRAALNPRDAKGCCACRHWQKIDAGKGDCRNPKMRHGITYKDKNTGEETHIEWWTTGCYHSCLNWQDASTPNAAMSDADTKP